MSERTPYATFSVLALVGRIAVIIFAIEALIMVALGGGHLSWGVVAEGVFDATALTLLSAPTIYCSVARPFVKAAEDARRSLATKVSAQARQALELKATLGEQGRLLAQNEELRNRLQDKSKQIAEINERILQRIGADLHDGPAQLLAYCLLRLRTANESSEELQNIDSDRFEKIRLALSEALREIRNTSTGLSDPRLESATLEQTVQRAISMHEAHTGTKVSLSHSEVPWAPPLSIRLCIYRFVQEGLTNAYRHANGAGQRVEVTGVDGLQIKVIDDGPGYDVENATPGLGLTGMRARIEALGGRLSIFSSSSGTTLSATFADKLAAGD
ncbi:MAG: sensor histidine kinase [Hyphomicrobiaceae bacterium]|nr:sensor histidine kinase [Hyphomicrobiaceae bacterium]